MHKFLSSLFFFLCLLPQITFAGQVIDQSVVYFIGTNMYKATNKSFALSAGITLKEFNLDGHRNLEKYISEGLPKDDRIKAERIANERLSKMDPVELREAFQGIGLAAQWDVRKAPAFVFNNGKEVIYGLTDVQQALKRWDYYRMTR